MHQSEAAQRPPDGAAMNIDAMRVGQVHRQFIDRDPALVGDLPLIRPVTSASLPCLPPFPCGRGDSDPVSCRSLIRSSTNFSETRKCRAASRCLYPSSTNAAACVHSSNGCGLPKHPQYPPHPQRPHHGVAGNPESDRPRQDLSRFCANSVWVPSRRFWLIASSLV